MTVNSVGDLSRGFQTRTYQARIKTEIDRLTQELSTGRTADIAGRVRGDFVPIAGIERDLTALRALQSASAEAASFAGAAQAGLGRLEAAVDDLAPTLLNAASINASGLDATAGTEAELAFGIAVEALNGRFAGRALFAGIDTSGVALASGEDMLAALSAAVSGETTAAGVASVVAAWFDPGGGFDTAGYEGATTPLAPMKVGAGTTVSVAVTANDTEIRDSLKGLAMGALLSTGPLTDPEERAELARLGGEQLLTSRAGLSELRAELGAVEAGIERATVRNAAETAALELARNEMLSTDPFESATRLEAIQSQLEMLYTITARTSQLSLADFLR